MRGCLLGSPQEFIRPVPPTIRGTSGGRKLTHPIPKGDGISCCLLFVVCYLWLIAEDRFQITPSLAKRSMVSC